jgi:hypothetical protein
VEFWSADDALFLGGHQKGGSAGERPLRARKHALRLNHPPVKFPKRVQSQTPKQR